LIDLGTTIDQKAVPATQRFVHALNEASGGVLHRIKGAINAGNDWINKAISGSRGSAAAAIVEVAKAKGVDPLLALATADHESSLNPNVRVMDHYKNGAPAGYSSGLFQLNEHGEGAGMSLQDLLDPKTNATVALTEIASVMKQSPSEVLRQFSRGARSFNPKLTHAQIMALVGTPGEIAAVAQRPADMYGYALDVNARYAKLVAQQRNTRPPTVYVKVSNPTQSRVSVSINGAALSSQR
jgi:hypothetical protein